MQGIIKIILSMMLGLPFSTYAQKAFTAALPSTFSAMRPASLPAMATGYPRFSSGQQSFSRSVPLTKGIPQNVYLTNLGFFCRKEWQWEKVTGIPVRFRLGSLEYCNRLEGKP